MQVEEGSRGPRGLFALSALAILLLGFFAGFLALGTWQVHRLAWKRDLIARVDQRVHAAPTPPPASAQWAQISPDANEYQHVHLEGNWLADRQTLVWASTEQGNGYWVMTPLRLDNGNMVLINRGFAPGDWCVRHAKCAVETSGRGSVIGLLRISQTHAFMRHNDPTAHRWYMRDVAAIAHAQRLEQVAPYFVDADAASAKASSKGAEWPQGGMTVIAFPNNHLTYLITWYLLALMVALAAAYVVREEYRLHRQTK